NHKLSSKQIDKAMDIGKDLDILYCKKLTPKQIDRAIDMGEYLDVLYSYQKNMSPEQLDRLINKAIEKGVDFKDVSDYQDLTQEQINKLIDKGKGFVGLYALYQLTPEQIDKAIDKGLYLDVLYENQENLSPENIDHAIDKGIALGSLFLHHKLTPKQIDKAIDKEIDLDVLYRNNKELTPENIYHAIEKGKNLDILYQAYDLTPEQIYHAIDKGIALDVLYRTYELTPEQLDKAIDKGKELKYLYTNYKLTPKQIDKALDKGEEIDTLCEYQKNLSTEQIDRAIDILIDKGLSLNEVSVFQNITPEQLNKIITKGKNFGDLCMMGYELTPEQINIIIEKREGLYYLYTEYKLTPEQIDKALEVGENIGELYNNQTLTPKQIDKALFMGKNLRELYYRHDLSPKQIDKAMDIGKDLDALYGHRELSSEQIDRAIDKGEYLDILYMYQKNFSTENIDHAIDKGEYLDVLYEHQKSKITPEQKARIEQKLNIKLSIYNNTKPVNILPFKDLNIKLSRYISSEQKKGIRERLKMKESMKLSKYITSNLESRMKFLVQQYKARYPELDNHVIEEKIRYINTLDPTGDKATYTPWLVKIYLNNGEFINEKKARSLLSILIRSMTFPNFPKGFDINKLDNLEELETLLEIYNQEITNREKIKKMKQESTELGQIVFQKGEYKVLRIDNPKDILEFQRINNIDSWCIQNIEDARDYAPVWFLIKGSSIIGSYSDLDVTLSDRNNKPMTNPRDVRVFVEFLRQEGKEDEANRVLVNIPMTKEEIDRYLDRGVNLKLLYQLRELSPEQIDKAIDIGKDLDWLYDNQDLTPENINHAIEKEYDDFSYLNYLYACQDLTPENIDKAIKRGEYLDYLYRYQKNLTPKQKEIIKKKLRIKKSRDLYSIINIDTKINNKNGDFYYFNI
ncbi:MAG TPA: hypothetical protein P5513_06575, partial [Candidatus Diapherotrites archaeon]|nr:hypothetical protein [Candidatus Diapherotrites archaeon]